ncbi:flagellin, partial [Vibrio penaeicida]
TDFASETTSMTKAQILQQASTSILAQAKQAPNAAMSLLG